MKDNASGYFYSYLKSKMSYYSVLEADGQVSTILTHNLPLSDMERIIDVLDYIHNNNDLKLANDFYLALGNYISLKSLYCSNRKYCKDVETILNLPQEVLSFEDLYQMMKSSCYRKFKVVAKNWQDPLFFSINTFTEYMSPEKWKEFYSYIYYNKMEDKLPYDVIVNKRQLNFFIDSLVKEGKLGRYFSNCNPLKYDGYTLMISQNDVLSKGNKNKLLEKLYEIESKYDQEMKKLDMENPREVFQKSGRKYKVWGEDNPALPDLEAREVGEFKSEPYSDERVRVYADGQTVPESMNLSMEELDKGTHFDLNQNNDTRPSM